MAIRTIFLTLFGFLLVFNGVRALIRKETRASADGQPNRDYFGSDAVVIGLSGIVIGLIFLYAGLAPRDWPAIELIDRFAEMILDV